MLRWRGLADVPAGWGRCVATIGVFDGVHRGHARLIGQAVGQARTAGIPSVVVTFDPHPMEVIRPGTHPPALTTAARKAELVAELGVDALCVLPFTAEFARLSPAEFGHEVLVAGLHVADVVVGANFTFGHRAAGDVKELRRLGGTFGFGVDAVELLRTDSTTLSATYVRSCVEAGDVAAAADALGRPFRLDGLVARGDQRGRALGYPTANLHLEGHLAVPADGVYAGRAIALDERGATVSGPPLAPAAISVGTNPTFSGKHRQVEAYLLDFAADLYGQGLGIEFTHRLRGMAAFETADALVTQMGLDVARTRELLS
jgi:riboflavin kinase / FMN adenylyltransferase